MSEKDFRCFSRFIQDKFGIKMPVTKKVMLESRLMKRLRHLDMAFFKEYRDYVFSPGGMKWELSHMIDVVTTNTTDFFREPGHFEILSRRILPESVTARGGSVRQPFTVWSAGCSTGEEPYTLAMVIENFAENYPGFHFLILGTDVSTKALKTAARGVYSWEKAKPIPRSLRKKYLMRSRDREQRLVRIIPELRAKAVFQKLNLVQESNGLRRPVEIIFCRNVIIYFNNSIRERLIRRLCGNLVPGGHLFLGHSETLHGIDAPLVQVGPMIYRKTA